MAVNVSKLVVIVQTSLQQFFGLFDVIGYHTSYFEAHALFPCFGINFNLNIIVFITKSKIYSRYVFT